MKKILALTVLLFGLFSILILYPPIHLNAQPRIISRVDATKVPFSLIRNNVTIRAVTAGTREPIPDKYLMIHKYALWSSNHLLLNDLETYGFTDNNGEFKVRLPKIYQIEARGNATLGGEVSSSSYFVQSPGNDSIPSGSHPTRYYEFKIAENESSPSDKMDEERNYPEVTITIEFPSPDIGTR